MEPNALPQLIKLEALRGNPIFVYHSGLTDDGVRIVYEYLRKRGQTDRLDLVLSTVGGSVTRTRQVALLLREYVHHLTILVPYRAWSAGTLLCLSADELVLGPMAELGPIDSQIGSADRPAPDAPTTISAEDIRVFRQMAEDWFGVKREEDRLQVLALVAQRFFPTSLSSFYRYDKLVRQVASELLAYQLPDIDAGVRQRIVDQLVGGYYAHDYVLSRNEVQELGLRARYASSQEESLLWDLSKACRAQVTEHPEGTEGEVVGLIVGTGFRARRVFRRMGARTPQGDGSRYGDPSRPEERMDFQWEIDP